MRRGSSAAFPVGLYGTLLLASCWLLLPAVFRPLEALLLGVACLPQQWLGHAGGQPALAADARAAARLRELHERLREGSWEHDVERGRALLPPSMEPLLCRVARVVPAAERRGGGDLPCELQLDRTYAELSGCADLVTCGDALLGFLARPGTGPAVDDEASDPARVLLLNHPHGREVAAQLPLGRAPAAEDGGGARGGGSDGDLLRCVVGAAAIVDLAPLRTALHDDPYRAAGLEHDGGEVRTLRLEATWTGSVPAGLLLGRTRVWGYDRPGEVLTIGIFVEPPFDPRALPQVVVWQTVPGPARALPQRARTQARLWQLPDPTGGRWLLACRRAVPDGAAVVQDGVCLGTARGIAFGQALCTSFAASRQPWALWLLPDDAAARPRGLYGEVVRAEGATAWFRPRRGEPVDGPGFVFTGGGQPQCPAGLLIGRAEPVPGQGLLRIVTPLRTGAQQVEVVVEEG